MTLCICPRRLKKLCPLSCNEKKTSSVRLDLLRVLIQCTPVGIEMKSEREKRGTVPLPTLKGYEALAISFS